MGQAGNKDDYCTNCGEYIAHANKVKRRYNGNVFCSIECIEDFQLAVDRDAGKVNGARMTQ